MMFVICCLIGTLCASAVSQSTVTSDPALISTPLDDSQVLSTAAALIGRYEYSSIAPELADVTTTAKVTDIPSEPGGCVVPFIVNGTVVPKPDGYRFGDRASVACDVGYVLSPTYAKPVITCHEDGTWGTSEAGTEFPTCRDIVDFLCPLPTDLNNGGFKIHPSVMIDSLTRQVLPGARAIFSCNVGYQLSAGQTTASATCENGKWSSPAPSCKPVTVIDYCGAVPEIAHARHYDISGTSLADGKIMSGTKVMYICDAGFRQQGSPTVTCVDGRWSTTGPICVAEISCTGPPPAAPHADFTVYQRDSANSVLDVIAGGGAPNGAYAYYYCRTGYRIQDANSSTLVCVDGQWRGRVPSCIKRTGCDPPMDIENGNWIIRSLYADFRFGVKVSYECEPGFKPIGMTDIECVTPGYWSSYPPKCVAKEEYCSEPAPIHGGFYMCKPSQCDSFHMATELHYVCNKDYELRPGDQSIRTCLPGGVWWPRDPPVCLPVDFVATSPYLTHLSTNTVTVVVSSSCAVLGLLVLVMLVVALQRRLKLHSGGSPSLAAIGPGSLPDGSGPYSIPPRDEHDRLALIAFADDIRGGTLMHGPPLPSYEEAIRGSGGMQAPPPHFYGFSRYIDGGSRTSSGRSSRSADYRPLTGGRVVARDAPPVVPPADHHRNSIITTASNNLSAGVAFGSMDTVNAAASETASTSVTVDTYDTLSSNPSQRAAAGSIESGSIHGSLSSEAAPLLDPRGATLSPDHRDASGACDTLRSQTSRGTHSDTASCIVEVPEDVKDD